MSGLLGEDDNEYFTNCIVFPVFSEAGKPVCIYGLNIETNNFVKPVYFDKVIPIFNEKVRFIRVLVAILDLITHNVDESLI